MPVLPVGEHFWRRAVDFDFQVEDGVIDLADRELFWFAETAQDIWDGILRWYEVAGEPLAVPAQRRAELSAKRRTRKAVLTRMNLGNFKVSSVAGDRRPG